MPFVAKALCLPDVVIDPKVSSYKEIDRNLIVDRDDLFSFQTTWRRLFPKSNQMISKNERAIFLDSFAKESSPKALLDMLRDNRQLVIEGGPGSGKTWLALEHSSRSL